MITDSDRPVQTQLRPPISERDGKSAPGKWQNIDLFVISVLALFLPLLVLVDLPMLRLPVGIVVVLMAPGYLATVVLFPGWTELNGATRLALSFGLSVVVIAALALLLTFLPWGLRLWPVVVSMVIWNVGLSIMGGFQRYRQGGGWMPGLTPWWRSTSRPARTGLVVGGVLAALILFYCLSVLTARDPSSRLTEFYVLSSSGLVEDYPRQASPGQPVQVKLGVVNQEGQSGSYRIEIRNGGEILKQIGPFQLAEGTPWEQPVEFSLKQAGKDQIVEIWLFEGQASQPYRRLRLWLNIE